MSDNQRLTALIKFLEAASAEVIEVQIKLAEEQGASFDFSQAAEKTSAPRPADAQPLWAERKPGWNTPTGQKASPALWIKMHYGNKDIDNWEPMGLKREEIRHDVSLYNTYAKWIKNHTSEDLGLPSQPRSKADPEISLNKHRRASLASYHKHK